MTEPKTFRVSVTELAHFCCRRGDVVLGSERSPSAQQGQEGHKHLQSQRPDHYQREVAIKNQWSGTYCMWTLAGRIDGLLVENGTTTLEEIKTTFCAEQDLPDTQYQVHLAQLKLYGALFCKHHSLNHIQLRLTYLKLDDESTFEREHCYSAQELIDFLQQCSNEYTLWLDGYCQYLQQRDADLSALEFPFQNYREGQRTLSVAIYRHMRDQQRGLYHAPTGLGKTMATLFPALRQLADGTIRQVWYLTAKNSGHNSVKQALSKFSRQPQIRVLFLQAKEKVCINCDRSQINCKAQTGYYDRLPAARQAFQSQNHFSDKDLQKLAEEYNLCPHQLARDLLPWVDLVVADYNYVFDPQARLGDALAESKHISLLVDEAHNLPDRARTMFSADLYLKTVQHLQRNVTDPMLQKRLRKVLKQYRDVIAVQDTRALPESFVQLLQSVIEPLNEWFSQQNWLLFPEELFEHMMSLWRFAQRSQTIAGEDALLYSARPGSNKSDRIQIFCTDPAPNLQTITDSFHSCHFFSGSLLPLDYFQRSIQQQPGAHHLALPNPFPAEHQCTLVIPVNTRFQRRTQSIKHIAETINSLWESHPGRYLMALPSYEYLAEVMAQLALNPELPLRSQPQTNDLVARAEFLRQLQGTHYLAGVIAGGVFAEGIDLEDNKLDGVIIIGACLPPPSPEREHIKQHFEDSDRQGFEFAYRYPAINRVIQTAGRLIRSEQDRGLLLLMDDRFTQTQYRTLLPDHWQPQLIKNSDDLQRALASFFGK